MLSNLNGRFLFLHLLGHHSTLKATFTAETFILLSFQVTVAVSTYVQKCRKPYTSDPTHLSDYSSELSYTLKIQFLRGTIQ